MDDQYFKLHLKSNPGEHSENKSQTKNFVLDRSLFDANLDRNVGERLEIINKKINAQNEGKHNTKNNKKSNLDSILINAIDNQSFYDEFYKKLRLENEQIRQVKNKNVKRKDSGNNIVPSRIHQENENRKVAKNIEESNLTKSPEANEIKKQTNEMQENTEQDKLKLTDQNEHFLHADKENDERKSIKLNNFSPTKHFGEGNNKTLKLSPDKNHDSHEQTNQFGDKNLLLKGKKSFLPKKMKTIFENENNFESALQSRNFKSEKSIKNKPSNKSCCLPFFW